MFQNKKLIVILLLIMCISLASNWEYIFKPKGKKPILVSASAEAYAHVEAKSAVNGSGAIPVQTLNKEIPNSLPKGELATNYQQMLELSQRQDWGADPFGIERISEPKVEQLIEVKEPPPPVTIQEEKKKSVLNNLQVESILITAFQSMAVINKRLVVEGDIFQGMKILQINKDSVILEVDGIPEELKIKGSDIPMASVTSSAAEAEKRK